MAKEYDAFIDEPSLVPDGEEMVLDIRELNPDDRRKRYRARYVRAVISHSPDQAKDDILWLRYERGGRLYPRSFGIKITAELGEYQAMAEVR